MRHLMYAVDLDTGEVWSRLEGDPAVADMKVAVPVLEYEKIGEGGDFTKPLTYHLERMSITALIHARLRWTRKVPLAVRNLHREFWGMSGLPARPKETTLLG